MTTPAIENASTSSEELFAAFDHTRAPLGLDGTPYTYYEKLRDAAETTPIGWSEELGGFWVAAGYGACNELLHEHFSFSNAAVTFPAYSTGQDSPLKIAGQDEPSHKKDRAFVNNPFSPKRVQQYDVEVRQMTNRLIDAFIEDGEADLGVSIGEEVPARLTARILGLPEDEGDTYRRWCWAMSHLHATDPEAAGRTNQEMHDYFNGVLSERKRNPGGDVLSLIAHTEINGERLSDEDLLGFCITLLIGGIDNSTKILNALFWRMGWDVELRRRLLDNPPMINSAIDEALRYYTPGMVGRVVVDEDIVVADVEMKKDDVAVLALPVANRDRRVFENPDSFVPDRAPNKHIALGGGVHRCLGTHLLRVEVRAVMEEFLQRIPHYSLHPSEQARWVAGQVQGMSNVPVVFSG